MDGLAGQQWKVGQLSTIIKGRKRPLKDSKLDSKFSWVNTIIISRGEILFLVLVNLPIITAEKIRATEQSLNTDFSKGEILFITVRNNYT